MWGSEQVVTFNGKFMVKYEFSILLPGYKLSRMYSKYSHIRVIAKGISYYCHEPTFPVILYVSLALQYSCQPVRIGTFSLIYF
jgi:hypothetical protein